MPLKKVASQILHPNNFKNSDLHDIVTNFQKIIDSFGDDFRRIALTCGIEDSEIDKISNQFIEKFKKNSNYPLK